MNLTVIVKEAIELVAVENAEHVLCYLDLDQFKVINDTCGHLAGEELLRQLSEVLKKHIRTQDFIARLGGDEFGVLMCYCSLADAYSLCENLRDVIKDFRFGLELALMQGEMQWVEKIQRGIENNSFCLYGQPIVSISRHDEGLHFETLIRYREQTGRIIAPYAFWHY